VELWLEAGTPQMSRTSADQTRIAHLPPPMSWQTGPSCRETII
jgi:hypothetical protein